MRESIFQGSCVCVWWHGYESGVIDDFEKLRCETGQQHNLFIIKVAVFPEKEQSTEEI